MGGRDNFCSCRDAHAVAVVAAVDIIAITGTTNREWAQRCARENSHCR